MNKQYEWNVGDMIGFWEYLGEAPREKGEPRKIRCKCTKCGEVYDILISNLTRSKHLMCKGCVNRSWSTKNGLSRNPLYGVLKDMHARCEDERHYKYPNYGGRGIIVCEEWSDTLEGLENFILWSELNGYKKGLQLDRFDNDLGYSPENCRWVTPAMNNFNRRGTKGYRFHRNRWEAYITVNKKMIYLGHFLTEEEAREARRKAELEYYGENSPAYRDAEET